MKDPKETNIVEVTRKKVRTGPSPATIKKRAQKILHMQGCKNCELSIVLCDDSFIHELNKTYRKRNKPTDVLSFPMSDTPKNATETTILGDVIISIDTAQKQAASRKHPLLFEVTTLLIHGVLHLLGHTHENDEDEKQMNAVTQTLLESI